MYKILAFENGQPIIFYHSGENVYMYTALKGHLHSEGLLFNDVKQDFEVYDGNRKYLYYISTDNQIKLASLVGNKFTEFLSIPLENKENGNIIVNVSPVMCENELYIFYCTHNKNSNNYDIYYLVCSSPNHACLIKRDVENSEDFDVASSKHKTYIILRNDCYYLSKNGRITIVNSHDSKKINSLHETIEQLRKNLSEKSNQLIEAQKKLYTKNVEISNLKAAQNHLSKQYNELSESAGKLQDELRKIKFM
jgi:hypothetical protein